MTPMKASHIKPSGVQRRSQSQKLTTERLKPNGTQRWESRSSFFPSRPFADRHMNPSPSRKNINSFSIDLSKIDTYPPKTIQAKMDLYPATNSYEMEADRVARQVVNTIPSSSDLSLNSNSINIQAKKIDSPKTNEDDDGDDDVIAQPQVSKMSSVSNGSTMFLPLKATLRQSQGEGHPLAANVRWPMENAFRADFSHVRLHTNDRADQLNRSLQSRAFTTGRDIYLRRGEYNPKSKAGQELMAHELTHVIQQSRFVSAPCHIQRKLKRWGNPHLEYNSIPVPDVGANTVKEVAERIDNATETGYSDVQKYITFFKLGTVTTDSIQSHFEDENCRPNKVRSFTDKLIRWYNDPTEGNAGLVKADAGSIIEEYANNEGKLLDNVKLQVVVGGSRPDFEVDTKASWNYNTKNYKADGFIDITSKKEADKGHIVNKMLSMTPDDSLNHPYLYDSYYEDIDFGDGSVTKTTAQDESKTQKQRMQELTERLKLAEDRKKSLRSYHP